MKANQNIILVILICILLSFLLGIETVTDLSISKNVRKATNKKINKQQINIEIIWNVTADSKSNQVEKTKKLIKDIISNLNPQAQVGIEIWANKAEVTNISFPVATNNQQRLLNFIDQIKPADDYLLNTSLLKAKNKLKVKSGAKHILVFSDGYKFKNMVFKKIINKLNKENIKIHVIQVGDINPKAQNKLKLLAELGKGKYSTYSQTEKIISTINSN